MKAFQITLKGYDGGTDTTDHLIIWISAIDRAQLDSLLIKLQVPYESVDEMGIDPLDNAVDFNIAVTPVMLMEKTNETIKELDRFMTESTSVIVDGLKRYHFSTPQLIMATQLLAQKEILKSFGCSFDKTGNADEYTCLDDNVESWL